MPLVSYVALATFIEKAKFIIYDSSTMEHGAGETGHFMSRKWFSASHPAIHRPLRVFSTKFNIF